MIVNVGRHENHAYMRNICGIKLLLERWLDESLSR